MCGAEFRLDAFCDSKETMLVTSKDNLFPQVSFAVYCTVGCVLHIIGFANVSFD